MTQTALTTLLGVALIATMAGCDPEPTSTSTDGACVLDVHANLDMPDRCWEADWCGPSITRPWLNQCGRTFVCWYEPDQADTCMRAIDCDCLAAYVDECGDPDGEIATDTPDYCEAP